MAFEHTSLAALAERFEAFLVDQFGVLLNGAGCYSFAPTALSQLGATGKPVILLSNSGKCAAPNEARLTALGFDRAAYQMVLSSGEAAHAELSRRIGDTLAPGTGVWLHARDNDTSAIDGLALTRTDDPANAGLILLAGSLADQMSMDDYRAMLAAAAQRQVPCLCTNPDMEMLTPTGTHPGAGAIAALYQSMGGAVDWIGKPYPLIYAEARRRLPDVAPARILTIGDSPAHDIAGGQGAGMATALVRTGLHERLSDAVLRAECVAKGHVPDFVIPRFSFEVA